jgi:hypothetical protein
MARFNVSPGVTVIALRDITSNTARKAFRNEAIYHISTFHDQGGDAVHLHQLRSGSDRRSWFDREDLGALAIQNILNGHEQPRVSGEVFF